MLEEKKFLQNDFFKTQYESHIHRIVKVLIVLAHHQVLDDVPVAKSQLGLQIIHNASICLKRYNLKLILSI